jgi:TonB family protein
MAKTFLSDDSPHKKSSPIMVTLMKPPPPPQIKEKPPEPEQLKQPPKEEIFTPTPEDSNPGLDKDNTPAGDSLGVDAEGTAGGDAFGLVGKKGGRSLLAGEGGSGGMGRLSLLIKFAGYAHTVEAEIRKKVMKRLDQDGGIPKGKLQAGVRVRLDGSGAVVDYKIIGSSGNRKMDEAVKQALSDTKLSEPPPDGMPRTMIIKISSQG